MPDSTDNYVYENQISQGKNKGIIKCKYCSSTILGPSTATFTTVQFKLPLINQTKIDPNSEPDVETLSRFWVVNDIFTFENVGFSHTVGNNKYLTCADCETGPIGYHDISTKISYVSFSRVEYT